MPLEQCRNVSRGHACRCLLLTAVPDLHLKIELGSLKSLLPTSDETGTEEVGKFLRTVTARRDLFFRGGLDRGDEKKVKGER